MLQTLWLGLWGKSINRNVRVKKVIFVNIFSHLLLWTIRV